MKNLMKHLAATAFCLALLPLTVSAADYRLTSPDGGLVLEVSCGDSLTYRVEAAGEVVFTPSPLAYRRKAARSRSITK